MVFALEDPVQNQQTDATPAEDVPKGNIRLEVARLARKLMPKFGLLLFALAIPIALGSYPAYVLSSGLVNNASAQVVPARLTSVDLRTINNSGVEPGLFESRRHIEVTFSFTAARGGEYVSVVRKPWPSPGLKRKLAEEYAPGSEVMLYLYADKTVLMEEDVARDTVVRLTSLMGLLLVSSTLAFLIWRRLAARMPNLLPGFPEATFKSIFYGQISTLLLAGLMMGLLFIRPVLIPATWYLGAYLGLAVLLSLSLRMLVFVEEAAMATEPEEDGNTKTLRPA